MAKPKKYPPLVVVSGSERLLRQRYIQAEVKGRQEAGWVIRSADGSIPETLQVAMEGDLFGPEKETLVVVANPEKISVELVDRHVADPKYTVTLLLNIEGEPDGRTKFGKAVKGPWAPVHRAFPLPKEWDASKLATDFVVAEAHRHGQQIGVKLAGSLVTQVGTDLGMLAFEVEKISMLANAWGATSIDVKHAKGGMAPIAEASILPISEALGAQDVRALLRALVALRRTSKDDPTMRVCRFLGATVVKWFQVMHLDNLPPKAAAEELGVNPWYLENKLLPAAKRWGKAGTVGLVMDLAASERAVLNGALDPWTVMVTRLLSACRGAR